MFYPEARRGFDRLLPARVAGSEPVVLGAPRCERPRLGLGIVDDDTYRAACYIASRTNPDEYVFVGVGRHDKLFASNAALYFVSGRRPATRWYHLEPGLQTQSEIQQEMIEDLQEKKVRLIALDTRNDEVEEPNDSARSSGVTILDRYIKSNYAEVARFGDIILLARS